MRIRAASCSILTSAFIFVWWMEIELFLTIINYFFLILRQLKQAAGLDNLLYTPDADFSCFADLALSSPEDYYLEGQGSLLQ